MYHLAKTQPKLQLSATNTNARSELFSPLASAPGDLLLEIASCIDCRSDLLNFCLTVGLLLNLQSSTVTDLAS